MSAPHDLPPNMLYIGCLEGDTFIDGIRVNINGEGSRRTISRELLPYIERMEGCTVYMRDFR